jgi:hypothetical protein
VPAQLSHRKDEPRDAIEFAELPETISGKIRWVRLRDAGIEKHSDPGAAPAGEFSDR